MFIYYILQDCMNRVYGESCRLSQWTRRGEKLVNFHLKKCLSMKCDWKVIAPYEPFWFRQDGGGGDNNTVMNTSLQWSVCVCWTEYRCYDKITDNAAATHVAPDLLNIALHKCRFSPASLNQFLQGCSLCDLVTQFLYSFILWSFQTGI